MWKEESESKILEAVQQPKLQDETDDDYGEPDSFGDEDADEHEFQDDSYYEEQDER